MRNRLFWLCCLIVSAGVAVVAQDITGGGSLLRDITGGAALIFRAPSNPTVQFSGATGGGIPTPGNPSGRGPEYPKSAANLPP